MESDTDREYEKSNREKNHSPKLNRVWCGRCDADLVSAGAKCTTCGVRNGSARIKKDTNAH